jgi:hypothetical protein
MTGGAREVEARVQAILDRWVDAARQATGPGDSWSLAGFDQQMISELAAAFGVEPWPGETLATASGLAWTRAWLAAALTMAPQEAGDRAEAFARATRSAGECLVET